MTGLFPFSGLAHDPQGVLAAVQRFALVSIKQIYDLKFCMSFYGIVGFELCVAMLTYADGWRVSLYKSQLALRHDCSLSQLIGRM